MLDSDHNNREDTAQPMLDGGFKTGNLGFLHDGELYVTGRSRKMLIIGGQNTSPPDIEATLDGHDHLIPGRNVAFGVEKSRMRTERLVMLPEATPEHMHVVEGPRRPDLPRPQQAGASGGYVQAGLPIVELLALLLKVYQERDQQGTARHFLLKMVAALKKAGVSPEELAALDAERTGAINRRDAELVLPLVVPDCRPIALREAPRGERFDGVGQYEMFLAGRQYSDPVKPLKIFVKSQRDWAIPLQLAETTCLLGHG